MAEATPEPAPEPRAGRLALSTAFFSFATGLSRIAGLVREIVAASYFGVRGPMSAFTIAFQVPNLIRSLFADAALQAAFVPIFTEQLETRSRHEAFRVASALVFVISISLGLISAIFVLAAPWVMPLFAPGFSDELTDLTVNLAQLMFPIVLLLGLSGLVVGVLNSFDHFSVPAIAPLFWNLVIIGCLVGLTPLFDGDDRIYAYAIGIVLGTIVQLLLPLPWLRKTGFRLTRDFNWRDERVMRVLKLMLPVTLGIGLINFNLSVNSIFATLISEEAPAAIDKAFRIYMLPQGVFAVALATVLFPTFSRLAARRDLDGLRNVQGSGTRQMLLLLVPAAALMLILSEPITRIVYQRGEFDAAQTDIVAEALFYFSLSLPFAGVNLIMIRTFFSLQLPWRPTQIALANLGVNAALDALLYKPMGVGGITLATAIVSFVTTVALAITLRREIGGVDMARTVRAGTRILAAGALCAAVALGVREALDGLEDTLLQQTVLVAAASAAGLMAYVTVVMTTRVEEARQISALVRGQLARLR
ncbi:MAG TPA: murein biosynthesis integral membrane protein MurJ [Solirubrobacterales bacterium]|nr:murein biosynthesis integral membrane protein MurJ [Solirubrobacterales bacterium]